MDPLTAQIQFTKRPILYMSRLGKVLLSNKWFRVVCGILLLAGCDVLAWMMTVSCLVVTGFVLYGVSMFRKRKECSIAHGKDEQDIEWLNETLGGDISLVDDALGQVIESCKSEKKSLIIVGVGLGAVLKRLEKLNHLMEQFENVKVLEPNETIIRKCKEIATSSKIEFLSCEYLDISKCSADIVMLQMEYLKHLDNKSIAQLIQNCRNIAKVGLIIGDLQRSNFIGMLTLINVGSCISTHDLLTLSEWNNFLNRQVKVETNQISSVWTFGRTTLMVSGNI
ncbi:predicted protein [Naegleria gruberi]|uniref:Predicted protein n=1 Tax=Naegleria gruberi TaxID=5762 RepID=D2VUA7_NAEGR|nr:uncharacterized protein NAEGRDRAFT_72594 [Naegleria gruberi]EFC39595.1 predicted protein [Naegleria gruberi]|eukprot:XP_002672339.1 predicted protein [Naegleria gruberi strain NEG-M]